jgi:predicted dithiol-disulfide oxidoreductase (DUF899 family)
MKPIELPPVVSRAEWLEARKALLAREKELTRARDRLNTERRLLPMVEVTEPYVFSGAHGELRLLDLFEGRQQLMVYHFMWRYKDGKPLDLGCPSCSGFADQIGPGQLRHLHGVGTTFAFISRAPWEKIAAFKARMGWPVPWYSSDGNRFNYDYHVTHDESVAPLEYNYRTRQEHEQAGSGYYLSGEQPFDLHGLSCFLRDGERVYHTYSSYGRGTEATGGSYYFLDLTALGRQEDWEEPKGRNTGVGAKAGDERIRYPDEQEDLSDSSGARPAHAKAAHEAAAGCCSRRP